MAETDLPTLIRAMSPRLAPGIFVFATVLEMPVGLAPLMTFQEVEGITLVLTRDEAEAAGLRRQAVQTRHRQRQSRGQCPACER